MISSRLSLKKNGAFGRAFLFYYEIRLYVFLLFFLELFGIRTHNKKKEADTMRIHGLSGIEIAASLKARFIFLRRKKGVNKTTRSGF